MFFWGHSDYVAKIISRHWSVFNIFFWHPVTDFKADPKVCIVHIYFQDFTLG